MKILQSGIFKRTVKKLHPQEKLKLDEAIRAIIEDTESGELKVGDLAGTRVYKYKINRQLTLLAYSYQDEEDELLLIAHGTHENFYRDLKR